MQKALSLLLTMGLTACGSLPVSPSETTGAPAQSIWLVNKIEARLARDPCVGSLAKWARRYEWRLSPEGWDRNVVDIDLRQAGIFNFRQGRKIDLPEIGRGQLRLSFAVMTGAIGSLPDHMTWSPTD